MRTLPCLRGNHTTEADLRVRTRTCKNTQAYAGRVCGSHTHCSDAHDAGSGLPRRPSGFSSTCTQLSCSRPCHLVPFVFIFVSPHPRMNSCGSSLQPCRVFLSQAVDDSVHCSVVVVSHTGALNNFDVDASIGPSITLPILPEFPVGVRDEETLSVTFASDASHF